MLIKFLCFKFFAYFETFLNKNRKNQKVNFYYKNYFIRVYLTKFHSHLNRYSLLQFYFKKFVFIQSYIYYFKTNKNKFDFLKKINIIIYLTKIKLKSKLLQIIKKIYIYSKIKKGAKINK